MLQDRKEQEAQFHNKRASDKKLLSDSEYQKKYPNHSFYSICSNSSSFFDGLVKHYSGDTLLDYCCGMGESSIKYSNLFSRITAIDISQEELQHGKENASKLSVNNITFICQDAEKTNLLPCSYDVVICIGVLHHLDLAAATLEIQRLLKPGGVAICLEALGHNPFINLYRRLTPGLRTAWETDHILCLNDITKMESRFSDSQRYFFHISTLAALLFRRTPLFPVILKATQRLDSKLLCKIPLIRRLSWQCIFVLHK